MIEKWAINPLEIKEEANQFLIHRINFYKINVGKIKQSHSQRET